MRLFRTLMIKAYFDKGYGLLNYFKYLVVLFGVASGVKGYSMMYTVYMIIGYTIACFVLGYVWFKCRLVDTEREIINMFDPFARDIRGKLKVKKLK